MKTTNFGKRVEKHRNTETLAGTTGYKEREDQSNPWAERILWRMFMKELEIEITCKKKERRNI